KVVELTKYDGAYPTGSFDGAGSVGGPAPFPSGLQNMSVNQETGQVFVGNSNAGSVYKFSATGTPEAFAALAPDTTLPGSLNQWGDVFVDNSSTATKGRIYAFPENGPVRANEADGSTAPGFPANASGACGDDTAPDGSLWIALWNQDKTVQLSSTTGSPTGASFATPAPCDLAIDSQGNFYTVQYSALTVRKYDSTGALLGTFDTDPSTSEPSLAI